MMALPSGKVLVVDSDEYVLLTLQSLLKRHGISVYTEMQPERVAHSIRTYGIDVLLADFGTLLKHFGEQANWVAEVADIDPDLPIVLFADHHQVDRVSQAIHSGAHDFILKPWLKEKVLASVSAALTMRRSGLEVARLRRGQQQLNLGVGRSSLKLIASSEAMAKVFEAVQLAAVNEQLVLIRGSIGSGKELVARVIHGRSVRSEDLFVDLDVSVMHAREFEYDCCGVREGQAAEEGGDRLGLMETAANGTLYIKNVGLLTSDAQAILLSILQRGHFRPMGCSVDMPFRARLICGTTMDLEAMAERGEFCPDLLALLQQQEVVIPDLCDRCDDIGLLADHFLERFASKYGKPVPYLSAPSLRYLKKYHWPGNVRELKHAMDRAVLTCSSPMLRPADFHLLVEGYGRKRLTLDSYQLNHVEKRVVEKVMRICDGDLPRAAHALGIGESQLEEKLQVYGLDAF